MGTFMHAMDDHTTVSAMLKAISVPTKEVDLVLVNGESVELSHVIKHDDRVSVCPAFESFDIVSLVKLRSRPLRKIRFVLDVHLGKLASHLRMLGFNIALTVV